MKQFILVLMLIIRVSSETVNPALDKCACANILSKADCLTISTCAWTAPLEASATNSAIAGSCGKLTTPTIPIQVTAHCPSITDPATNCQKTLGCAYLDNVCTHFTGCTAYVKTTNSDCQAISSLCITDGTQCTDAKSCNEYTEESQCTGNISISGTKKCKWDNSACRDYICSEADTTLVTDLDCNSWLQGCVTTGKGCTLTLGVCSSYSGDDVACSGLKGTDGNCEGVVMGTNCTARICSKAASILMTDTDCIAYQVGCITNGKGCVTPPLPACATYLGNDISCTGYIGSDGICEGDIGATNCRARICSNAPNSSYSDTLCIAYKTGCVTTGKGCVTSRSTCSSYSGTTTSCVGHIGIDGYCKGLSPTLSQSCAPKLCSEAPITTSTDAGCIQHQIGCKSTGKGCIATLGLCSSYSGTNNICEEYIGSDGNCKGTLIILTTCDGSISSDGTCTGSLTNTTGPCAPKICTEAPTSFTTNLACASYKSGCLTTGSGCVAPTECLKTIKSLTCIGTVGCGWNSICVASQNCSDFMTISICNGNNAILVTGGTTTTTPCLWTGSVCRNLLCTDAPNTNNSDSLCNTFLAGCLTKGNGCLDPSTSCTSYQGTRAICSAFTRKCSNFEGAIATTACTERVCTDDITSISDSSCNQFKTGCLTKGVGCIDPSKLCSDYSGIQSACDAFRGNNGLSRCWSLSTTVSSACIDKTCRHSASATSNSDCDTFLSGCLYNGTGCVSKSEPCGSYFGTQSQCKTFKANNGVDSCWNISTTIPGSCIVKNCSHSGALTSDTDCKEFLEGCLTNGIGCVPKTTACSSYTGTLAQCDTFTGNSKRCYKKAACADKACTDKASGVANNTECTNYIANCRYFNGGCVVQNICTGYPGNTLAKCQDVLDSSATPQKCWWTVGGTNCVSRTCANAPTATSQQDCINHLSTCVFNGSICLDQGLCSSFVAFGVDTSAKQTNCRGMKSSSGIYCWYTGGTNCLDRVCSNDAVPTSQSSCIDNCQWNGNNCVNQNSCSLYIPTGANDSTKLTICQAMQDSSSPAMTCYYVSGASNCESKSCSNAPSPSSQLSCDNHLSGKCGFNGSACIILGACTSYSPTGSGDSQKIAICQALFTNDPTPKKCTFLAGGSTCIDRTCDNVVSPINSDDCYKWIDKCQWNGTYCETTPPCSAYSTTGVKNGIINSICENQNVSSSTPLFCTQRAYAVATDCAVISCTTILNPLSLSDCTVFSTACRWSGIGICIEATACASYTVAAGTGNTQCNKLTDKAGRQCKYTGGTACVDAACTDKVDATSIADCTAWGIDCRYLGVGTCVTAAAVCAYTVTASDKSTVCNNVTDNGNPPQKCKFLAGASACSARSTCNSYVGTSEAACNLMYDVDGKQCQYISGSTCDNYKCSWKTDAIKAADCTNFGKKCRYLGTGICIVEAPCNQYIVTSLNGAAICSNLGDNTATPVQCSYLTGNACSVAGTCSSYNGLNDNSGPLLCPYAVNVQQARCKFALGAVACVDGLCSDKTDAHNIQDCAGCRYVGITTCVAPGTCASYNVSGSDYDKYTLCNTLTDGSGFLCTWVTGTVGTCVARDCTNIISPTSNASCIAWKSSCSYTGNSCIPTGPCASYIPTQSTIAGQLKYCAGIFDNTAVPAQCGFTDNNANICGTRSCVNGGILTNHSACNKWLSTCTFNGAVCVVGLGCNTYTQASLAAATINFTEQDKCRALKDNSNAGCLLDIPRCEVRTCANITPPPTSYSDCTNWLSTCRFTGNICVTASACDYTLTGEYAFVGKSNDEKIAFCKGLEDNTNSTPKVYCTLTAPVASGTVCIPRTPSNVDPAPTSQVNCTNWLSNSIYNGTTCVTTSACASYVSTGTNDATRGPQCRLMKDISGSLCGFATGSSQTNCIDRACSNAPTPSSDSDCSTYKANCTISNPSTAICLDITSACTQFFGLPAQCQSFTGNSLKCWSTAGASNSTPQACKVKECTDNTTSTTSNECEAFLSGCKTNGSGCALNAYVCSTLEGNTSNCSTFTSPDGILFCKVSVASVEACIEKACSYNLSSTTDSQCNSFMTGCLTNGKGCIDSTEPCSKYQGIQSVCNGFVGNGKKCWNPSSVTIATTYCVDKKCSDDTVSTTDIACNSSLTDCITKGTGCIEKTAACGSYSGTQAICSAFKGNSGTKPCWNVTTASLSTPCIEKNCIHNTTANSDTDCETFLPRVSGAIIPQCVTSGNGCVGYPRTCSNYTGTIEQCGLFTALDGPCKTIATGSTSASGACTPRICSEALNSNNTDTLCQTFHPTCVTTGFGCATSVSCLKMQEINSCSAKTGCSWVNNCRHIETDCSSLTSSSASICANTPVSSGSKKCSWYDGTCRAQTCQDLPASMISHAQCQAAISTCTTTGSGCITMSGCSAYTAEVICKAAKSTNNGDTCIWDTNTCRAKKCTDAPTGTTTNAQCDSYLNGCKTNGTSCVEIVTCSVLLTEQVCQVDENNKPCLFINGLCYSYSKCDDIFMTTHSACQQFSPLCTTNGNNCIAITTCAQTINQISCVVGTDGTCGWLPTYGAKVAKCQKFQACSDASAIDIPSCAAYGSNCITDGVKCIDKSTCSTYITQVACESNGTDGICQFIQSTSSCRLRECTDATATNASGGITTHSGCNAFIAKDKCTTNSTSCIAFSACASYTVEVGCFEGTDGLCIFALPIGQATGTLACRVKVCQDFIFTTNAACSVALTGAGLGTGCVSDGTNCIVKNLCQPYTSKEACNGSGSDGGCAFTPGSSATPNIGTCKFMSSCTDANNDSLACQANSQACIWEVSTTGTTTCSAHTCTSKAQGTACYPVPNFDLKTYTICGPTADGGCAVVGGITLSASTCQLYSLQTYTWDEINSKCIACPTSSNNDSVIGNVDTPSTDGNIIKLITTIVILVIVVI